MRITILTLALVAVMTASYGQNPCDAKVKHSVKGNSSAGYSIALSSKQVLTNVKVQLFDLYQGQVIQEADIATLGEKQVVFSNVKASLYTIYLKQKDCAKAKSVGGTEGIKIGKL